jgi:hypothetical protein
VRIPRPFTPPTLPAAERKALGSQLATGIHELDATVKSAPGKPYVPRRPDPTPVIRPALQQALIKLGANPRPDQVLGETIRTASTLGRPTIHGSRTIQTGLMRIKNVVARTAQLGLKRLGAGKELELKHIDAIETIVHEQLHGFGADVSFQHYLANETVDTFAEELSTELLARDATASIVGLDHAALAADHPLALPRANERSFQARGTRAYDRYIATFMHHVRDVSGWNAEQTTDAVRAAAYGLKASNATIAGAKTQLDLLVELVPELTAEQRIDLAQRFKSPATAIKSWEAAITQPRAPRAP